MIRSSTKSLRVCMRGGLLTSVLRRLAMVPVLSLATANAVGAQTMIEYDHANNRATVVTCPSGSSCRRQLKPKDTLVIGPRESIEVRVVGTNTAVYDIRIDTTAVVAPESVALSGLLSAVRSYLPDLGFVLLGRPRALNRDPALADRKTMLPPLSPEAGVEIRAAWGAGRDLEWGLTRVDALLVGPMSVRGSALAISRTLAQMRRGDVASLARQLRTELSDSAGRLDWLPTAVALQLGELHGNRNRALDAVAAVAGLSSADSLARIIGFLATRADSVLLNQGGLLAAAHHVSQIGARVAGAQVERSFPPVGVTALTGKAVTLSVSPATVPDLAVAAVQPPRTVEFSVMPRWRVRPSLGTGLLVIPKATFSTFAARSATGGTEIFESSVRDQRVLFGLSFGLRWNTSPKQSAHDVSVVLPELVLNPGADARAVGLGGGLVWRFVKFGAGLAWVRHIELAGQAPGQIIPNKDFLVTRETFGKAKVYFHVAFTESLLTALF